MRVNKNIVTFVLPLLLLLLGRNGDLLAQEPEAGDVEVVEPEADEDKDNTGPTVEDFFLIADIRKAKLSPQGTYVAYIHRDAVMAGNADTGYHKVLTVHGNAYVEGIYWTGDNTLLVEYDLTDSGEHWLYVMEVGQGNEGFGRLRSNRIQIRGYVDDTLPADPDHIIFAKIREEKNFVAADLFRVNLFEQIYPQTKGRRRLNRGVNNLFYYIRDIAGELALGVSVVSGSSELWRKTPSKNKWEYVWTSLADFEFDPIAIAPDGRTLWALSNIETDKVAAVSFDVINGGISETLFEHDRYDVSNILMSADGSKPIGVTYLEGGLYRYHYFEREKRETLDLLESIFVNESVVVIGRSDDETSQLVYVSSSGNPGAIHFCDVAAVKCDLVAKTKPWLDDIDLAETVALSVESTDDLIIEAFLTLPVGDHASLPLIAMPHGGPIGVNDNRYYSPDVQWLARNGYAVLQVNYRGSAGYGREFETAGLKEWGRGIEDDIEVSVRKVLADYPRLDAERVGILGSSYGGYSALISIIENPELYKCAASFAGVTDLTLLFNRSSIRRNDRMRERLGEMVGDYESDYDSLVEYSPVYQYERFRRPLFLAHGNNDPIVDVEHSWRLRKMLRLIGRDPEFHIFEDLGHGFDYVAEAKAFYDPLIAFLDKHLKPDDLTDTTNERANAATAQ